MYKVPGKYWGMCLAFLTYLKMNSYMYTFDWLPVITCTAPKNLTYQKWHFYIDFIFSTLLFLHYLTLRVAVEILYLHIFFRQENVRSAKKLRLGTVNKGQGLRVESAQIGAP